MEWGRYCSSVIAPVLFFLFIPEQSREAKYPLATVLHYGGGQSMAMMIHLNRHIRIRTKEAFPALNLCAGKASLIWTAYLQQ